MKFGKEFKKHMVPEWTEAYMNYNDLKRILREILHDKQNSQQPQSRDSHHRLIHRTFSGLHNLKSNSNTPISVDVEDQDIAVNTFQKDKSLLVFKTNFLKHHEEGGEKEVIFFRQLDEELNRTNTFYKEKVEEAMHEAALLTKQIDALVALRIIVENPEFHQSDVQSHGRADVSTLTPLRTVSSRGTSQGSEHMDLRVEANGRYSSRGQDHTVGPGLNPVQSTKSSDFREEVTRNDQKREILEILDHVKINNTIESPISTIKGVFSYSKEEELRFDKEQLRKVEEQLKRALIEFYQKLRRLKHYSFMNLSAFSKIMKKYEKFTSRRASAAYMKIVDNSYLGNSDEVTDLLARVESTFINDFSNSNRKKAMKLLRPKEKRERHSIMFCSGFFSGFSTALLVAIVLTITAHDLIAKAEGTSYIGNILPLYRRANNPRSLYLFAYIVIHMLMYAANLYFWRRYQINYPFIFGFKQGTELGYREVFFISNGLAVLALAGFLANMHLDMNSRAGKYRTVTELVPLGLVIVVLLIIFCPFSIIYRSSRFFFIKCMFRCLCAPLYQVTLPDFFLADQLTSQVQAIRSLELYVCYYGLEDFSRRQQKCHSHGVYNSFYFVVAVIPFWLRFLQCFRQLCELKDAMHAFNALKYFTTIIAILIRTAYELKKGTTWMILALLSSIVATIGNTYWDMVVDWGLVQRHSKNLYLRNKLLVSRRSIYYAAMFLNVLLRLVWVQWVLEFNWRPFHKVTITTVISCLEIIRRGIWSFFRLENEHLNNVGKFRAFKSVPLPFNYYNEDEDGDGDDDDDDTDTNKEE